MIGVQRAVELMSLFAGRNILVVGDLMLDEYVVGSVTRISPEAPVPVVHVGNEYCRPGGAANVALNIKALGGNASVAGIIGDDVAGRTMMKLLSDRGIAVDGVLVRRDVRTTVKTRVIADRQQIARVDRESEADVFESCSDEVIERIRRLSGKSDGVVVEDYGKGVVCQAVLDGVMRHCAASGKPVGLDPRFGFDLKVKGLRLATPNYKEARAAAELREVPLRGDPATDVRLAETADVLMEKWDPDCLLITLGPQGMYLRERVGKPLVMPTRAREVFDVSGAGDTVIGAAMLAMVAGGNAVESAALANFAAGVVVGKVGTATCSPEELISSMK